MFIGSKTYLSNVFRLAYEQAEALLSAGKQVDVSVSEHKAKRTNAQNDFYWHQNEFIAKFLNECDVKKAFGLPFKKDDIHEINKKYLGTITTTKLSTKEFCEYIERMFAWWIDKTDGQIQFDETPYSYLERTGLANEE